MRIWVLPLLLPLVSAVIEVDEVLVFTVATDPENEGLLRLLKTAKVNGIEPQVLGLGTEWNGGDTRTEQGGGQKIRLLKEALEQYKIKEKTMILFVDAYDVVFTQNMATILDRFDEHFSEYRILFGAEPFCWPDDNLAIEYPLVSFGKRFLNSGLFMGFAPELYKMVSIHSVADNDDDQLFYTHIYLDEKLRSELKIGLDSMSRIFQNLNGVADDVELQFDDEGNGQAFNAAYNTHPAILHGNGPSKKHLNYLANYVAKRWSSTTGCAVCNKEIDIEKIDEREFPLISVTLIIAKPIPFVEEVLEAFAAQNYPKKKLALFIYNSQQFSIKTITEFLSKYGPQYYTKRILNGITEIGEREARKESLLFAQKHKADFVLNLDCDALLKPNTIRHLVSYALNYDVGFIGPLLAQPGKPFTNFWGDIAQNGYYKRSEDYMAIVQRKRIGYFNVPFITTVYLMNKYFVEKYVDAFSYNMNIDPDMSLCEYARHKGFFMFIDNEEDFGELIVSDDYAENVHRHYHAEMWEIFANPDLWEARYLHPKYRETLEAEVVPQECPDVYDYPLLSERYCKEIIEVMEAYGKWSDGSNQDKRLAGGYENVPTRDIHMNQIGYERHWLYFLDRYVRPMQEKVFLGYYHQPVESHMMFVVRYKPDEQPSLRPHHDASTFSIDIALNKKGRDYEGGGVRYIRYNCTVAADEVGYAMMFPGRLTHLHEGLPTTSGTRYILVSFINP